MRDSYYLLDAKEGSAPLFLRMIGFCSVRDGVFVVGLVASCRG